MVYFDRFPSANQIEAAVQEGRRLRAQALHDFVASLFARHRDRKRARSVGGELGGPRPAR